MYFKHCGEEETLCNKANALKSVAGENKMFGRPGNDQILTVLTVLAVNTPWEETLAEQLQVAIAGDSKTVGKEFAAFIRNGFRVNVGDFFRKTGELTINIPALPRPTYAQLQKKFSWIKGVESNASPTDAVTLSLGTVLRPGEGIINGVEYERRWISFTGRFLGYQHLRWLVDHQDEFPALMALLDQIYIDGPGLVVVSRGKDRGYPCLIQADRRWDLDWSWTSDNLGQSGRLAVSGK
ncbi:MAG: hypothetical protein WCW90_01095 [Candidatus Paceibacterota bacterium]